jgi:hypothetical protein
MGNSIHVLGDYYKDTAKKIKTGQTLKPGMLVDEDTAGVLIAHGTEGGRAVRRIMVEDALQGNTKDDAATAGELANTIIEMPGNRSQLLLASGINYTFDMALMSAGNGKFTKHTGTNEILAYVKVATDLSDSTDDDTLVVSEWV